MKRLFVVLAMILCFSTSVLADEWTGEDKYAHFGAGVAISMTTYCFCTKIFGMGYTSSVVASILSGTLAGAIKESLDRNRGGEFSVPDLAFTMGGSVFGTMLVFAFDGGFQNWHVEK